MPQNEAFVFDEALTFAKSVGCGMIYCIFEEREGAFHKLRIRGDAEKETPCGEAWFRPVASLLTFALRRSIFEGITMRAIVKQLQHQRCPSAVPNKDHIVSCSDAIGRCVLEYLKRCDLEGVNGHD